MAWIELHQTLRNHPKLIHLARLVKIDDRDLVRAKLENLWMFCLDYRENGRLRSMNASDVAEACNWRGDATLWLRSLIEAGWIDEKPGGKGGKSLQVHDWQEYAGRLLAVRKKNRERMRRKRDGERATHVQGTCGATKPNQTKPNQTNQTEEEPRSQIRENAPEFGPGDEIERRLLKLAIAAKIPNKPETIRQYVSAWRARKNGAEVERVLLLPDVQGLNVLQIDKTWFNGDVKPRRSLSDRREERKSRSRKEKHRSNRNSTGQERRSLDEQIDETFGPKEQKP